MNLQEYNEIFKKFISIPLEVIENLIEHSTSTVR